MSAVYDHRRPWQHASFEQVEDSLPSLMKCEADCVVINVGISCAEIFQRVVPVARQANYFLVSVRQSVCGR